MYKVPFLSQNINICNTQNTVSWSINQEKHNLSQATGFKDMQYLFHNFGSKLQLIIIFWRRDLYNPIQDTPILLYILIHISLLKFDDKITKFDILYADKKLDVHSTKTRLEVIIILFLFTTIIYPLRKYFTQVLRAPGKTSSLIT